MVPIAVQATLRGVPMTTLLGRAAAEIKADGYDVPDDVHDQAVLRTADFPVDLREFAMATGYAWEKPLMPGHWWITRFEWVARRRL